MSVCFVPSCVMLTLTVLTRLGLLNANVNPDIPELELQTLAEVGVVCNKRFVIYIFCALCEKRKHVTRTICLLS